MSAPDSKPEVTTSARTTPNLLAKSKQLSLNKLESSRQVRPVGPPRPVSNVQVPKLRKGPQTMRLTGVGNPTSTPFENFSRFVDPSGKLNFSGKAVLHAQGVDFSNGTSYKINMNDLKLEGELGKGQFGTVQKVFHKPTNVIMAMKEIRLELEVAKLNQILMELDVLHQSKNDFIVDFYGAFFTESCVYYCMEYMDAGSLDKLYNKGVPEDVLAIIIIAMVKGLKFLKDKLNIIHRDVKPTNVLVNRTGEVKLCDFGVSGQLVKSLARTNVGSQSYMAPERFNVTENGYGVQSDVWSLGLTMVELATGKYPYPALNGKGGGIWEQLSAIVNGKSPSLPSDKFSEECCDFAAQCLNKDPSERPTYPQLLEHSFVKKYQDVVVDMKSWAEESYSLRQDIYKE
ncbi:hypothetical protein Glove_53g98 [Diversispora epigaea]|uniref:mitogen-activated protein kinase kinase n=1 Tax=Diversispora epigaea TaxID=1348612 RepID=A0A397JJS5_9GLOM|nr:hypothetical protein Glove_53g98 [Diversispora epigaea]